MSFRSLAPFSNKTARPTFAYDLDFENRRLPMTLTLKILSPLTTICAKFDQIVHCDLDPGNHLSLDGTCMPSLMKKMHTHDYDLTMVFTRSLIKCNGRTRWRNHRRVTISHPQRVAQSTCKCRLVSNTDQFGPLPNTK